LNSRFTFLRAEISAKKPTIPISFLSLVRMAHVSGIEIHRTHILMTYGFHGRIWRFESAGS
jgi:hypothetical protein